MRKNTATAPTPAVKPPRTKSSTAPPSLQAPPRPRPTGPRHDSLCIETYQESHALTLVDKQKGKTLLDQNEEDVPKLSRCYCLCAACWLPTGKARRIVDPAKATRDTGKCICRSCPCALERLNNTILLSGPTPSSKDKSSLRPPPRPQSKKTSQYRKDRS